ncbi:MAG TPA: hypothetical protein VGK73_37265 [Polyangiaceae bacterium]
MHQVHYAPDQTLREARDLYFRVNDFGENGGYDDAWVDFKLGPLPLPFPNTSARVRAVRYHDLHHVITGYETNALGEFEISAWEIAAGCKGYVAAWQLNLGGMFAGFLVSPRRIVRAFLRGRHSETLYDRPMDALLASTVGTTRESTGVDRPTRRTSVGDGVLFALALLAGLATALFTLPLVLLFLPLGLGTLAYRRFKGKAALRST